MKIAQSKSINRAISQKEDNKGFKRRTSLRRMNTIELKKTVTPFEGKLSKFKLMKSKSHEQSAKSVFKL